MTFVHDLSPQTIIVVALVAGVLLSTLPGRRQRPDATLVAKPLMTAREQAMLDVIEQILPGHRIHAQVSMGALLKTRRQSGQRTNPTDRNRFSQKIVDFVVQDRASGAVVALIEVDDSTHRASADQARDLMTARAGYQTIRIGARKRPIAAEIFEDLAFLLVPTSVKITAARD